MLLTKRDRGHKAFPEFAPFRFPELFNDLWSEEGLTARDRWIPAMDVSETETEYKVRLEAPGVSKDDIKIELENGVLTISGEKTVKEEHKEEKCYRVERRYGSFARSLKFTDIDQDNVGANFRDGVLEVTVKKTEQAKPKKIDIN
ncbi:MAG: Hsp20/alpha crystallin family protein [Nitrospinota bacterium]|nr:Hsp20/alpha crystallin family protein [Nitrospinota bacterium]MDH5757513.1 Hsp20/alpha crystallin family protein [Nitrospinota bacterium]